MRREPGRRGHHRTSVLIMERCRVCKGPFVQIPGCPPRIHPMCAPADENWWTPAQWAAEVAQLDAEARMPTATRFIVAGGRDYTNRAVITTWLRRINPQIARAMYLSASTIHTHLRRIAEKLGTSSRFQSVVAAHSRRYINISYLDAA